jgi:hypothetical protein
MQFKINAAPLSLSRQTIKSMEEKKTSTMGLFWWSLFFVSTAGLLFAIYSHWEWLTLILPFVATSFVKALRIM